MRLRDDREERWRLGGGLKVSHEYSSRTLGQGGCFKEEVARTSTCLGKLGG